MNNLRDYYERALQEFGTSDDGKQSLKVWKESKPEVELKNIYSWFSSIKDEITGFWLNKNAPKINEKYLTRLAQSLGLKID